MPFDDEADAVAKANDTEYGLSGSIFTGDVGRALRVARGIAGRQPVGELELRGALLDAVRRLQAVRPRPRARPGRPERVHRGEERLHRPLTQPTRHHAPHRRVAHSDGSHQERSTTWQDVSTARSPSSPGAAPASGWRRSQRFAEEGAQVVIGDLDDARGKEIVDGHRGAVRALRRHRQGPGRRAVQGREGHLRLGRHRLQQRRHLAARGRLDPGHRPRRLAPGAGGQPDQRVPVLQGGAALHARAEARVDHQHRLVRRGDGRGHLADLLLRLQGRRAVDVARARRAVRARRACGSTRSARGR